MAWSSQRRTISAAQARATVGVAAHAPHDVLGEGDPDLLVVDELGVGAEILEGGEPRRLVPAGVEREPVHRPDVAVGLRPELGPGPREREVDVEENGPQHQPSIGEPEIHGDFRLDGEASDFAHAERVPCGRSGCGAAW